MIGIIFCVLLALAAAFLGLAAARRSRWLHASLCGVCCLLAVYAALLLGLPVEAVAAMAVAVPGRVPTTCGAVSPHGDVCVRQEEHTGLCQSIGRRHASSPGQAGKPWRWYRDDLAAEPGPGPAAGTTPPRSWTVSLPAGMQLLNSNDRLHHAPKARITAALRAAGKNAAEQAGVPALQRAHVYGILCPATRARRDPANWYPSFKAFVDGLVDAGVLPDDDDAHLVGPDMRLGPVVRGNQIRLLVTELGPEAVAR